MPLEEDGSTDVRGRPSTGHAHIYRLREREHLASPSNDLDTHIQDILNVIKYEDLNDVVLIGHSYGGMVATEWRIGLMIESRYSSIWMLLFHEMESVCSTSYHKGIGA